MSSDQSIRVSSVPERVADGIVHVAGLGFAVVATVWMARLLIPGASLLTQTTVFIYAACLILMLSASAAYNIRHPDHGDGLLRKLDHAGIFFMIAGTYTPFALTLIGGRFGVTLLITVWIGAIAGAVMKFLKVSRIERFTVLLCLILGWLIVLAYEQLFTNASTPGLILLVGGGVLYTVGIIFYVWKSLPFQNATWHLFVLAAAICHFAAVMIEVVRPAAS